MPLNYKVLDLFGTTDDRLREIFTATTAKLPADCPLDSKQRTDMEADVKVRKELEEIIASRIDESILRNLKTSHLPAAVDLAWDSSVITKRTIPLVMYAQGRIDKEQCARTLGELKCADEYVKKAEDGKFRIDLPKFCHVNINLVRSVITRRVAAQSARFTNLFPYFRYEARGTGEVDKLKADLFSQRVDIMADQFGYREQGIQWMRDMLLYPHAMVFPASKWEREVMWDEEDSLGVAQEFQDQDGKNIKVKSRVVREGVPLVGPHYSRTFYDIAHPIQSINTDTGCTWFGYWDLTNWGKLSDNNDLFNRDAVGLHSQEAGAWVSTYASYFNQYYNTTISFPEFTQDQIAAQNDRTSNAGYYSGTMRDQSVFVTNFYMKLTPNQYRIGKYPWPVWVHFIVANSRTVVHAEIMPDCPGFVFSFNESAQRLFNLSMAHDLMPFQDQLTNLFSQLLETVKRDLFGIAVLNKDVFGSSEQGQKDLEKFRTAMKAEDFFSAIAVLEVSLISMRDLGVDMEKVFKIIRQESGRQLSEIMQAIQQTILLAERIMALSPQEQAQLSPRETSATEVQVIAGTTENIYQFISDSIDAGRAAIKRYLYNATLALATDEIELPVVNRYRRQTARAAGFEVRETPVSGDVGVSTTSGNVVDPNAPFSVSGKKKNLVCEYVFNARDGADRSSNIQAAQTLTQLLGVLMNPAVLRMLTKGKLSDVVNAIMRQSGTGIDVMVEPEPGTENQPVDPGMPAGPAAGSSVGQQAMLTPADTAAAQLPR